MDPLMNAWEQVLRTGRVSDYLSYRQSLGAWADDDENIPQEDDPDADDYAGSGDWYPKY